jgi:hypothetical protein
MLSEVLKWIEENVQPAESLMAMRPRPSDQPRQGRARSDEDGADDGEDTVAQVLDMRGSSAAGAPPESRG